MPRISVLLPVFNEDRYIVRTITSLLMQTFNDFELVIVDNASTDETYDLCRHFAKRDPRIQLHRNSENVGAYDNNINIFKLARGELVNLLGGHDLLGPDYLIRAISIFSRQTNPTAMATTACIRIDAAGNDLGYVPIRTDLRLLTPMQRVLTYVSSWSWPSAVAILGLFRRDWLLDSLAFLQACEGQGRFLFWDLIVVMDQACRGDLVVDPHPELRIRMLDKHDLEHRGRDDSDVSRDQTKQLVLAAVHRLVDLRFARHPDKAFVLDFTTQMVERTLSTHGLAGEISVGAG